MADNILKLRVESSEYDQKLKKAAEGIRHLAEVAYKGGGKLTGLEKAELDYVKALGSMETKSRTAAGSVRELESTFKELTVVYNNLNDVEKQDEGGKALRASLDQIKRRAQAARAELDAASKSLQGAENSMKGGGFGGMMGKISGTLGVSPVMLTGIGAATAAFAGLKAVIGDNISTAKGFEKSMSQLSSLTGMTGKDLDKLKEYAIDLGSTSTLTASQVADAFRLIGSQQPQLLSSGEALKEVTKYAITLSEAAGIDLQTAAQTLSTSINQMGGDSNNAARYVNVLAAASQKGAGDIAWLGEAITKSATAAKAVGTDYEELVANLEQLAKAGFDASTAGTALRSIIMNLEKQANNEFKPSVVGLTQAFENLGKANLDIVGYQEIAGKMFASQAMALANASQEAKKMTEAITGTNIAEAQAKTNTDNLDGALKSLASAWEGLNLHLNSSNGYLKTIVDGLKDVVVWADKAISGLGEVNGNREKLNGEGNGGQTKVDRMVGNLKNTSIDRRQSVYTQQVSAYWKYINDWDKKLKEAESRKDVFAWETIKKNNDIAEAKANIAGAQSMLKEYQSKAQKYLKTSSPAPSKVGSNNGIVVDVDVDTEEGTKSIKELQNEIKKLKKLRDDAADAGDTKLRDQYNAQIKSVQAEIKSMRGGSIGTKKNKEKELTELQQNQQKINDLTQEYVKLGDESTEVARERQAEIQKEIELLQQRNGLLGKRAEQAQGRLLSNDDIKRKAEIDIQVNTKQIEDLRKQLAEIEGVTIDPKTIEVNANTSEAQQKIDELKAKIAELEDKNINIKAFVESIGKPLGEGLNNTPGTLLKAPDTTIPRGGLLLDDKAMNAVQKNIDKQMKGVGNIADEWSGVASAIGAVGNAMAGIEDPAAKVLGIVAQAIATVALTFSKSLAGTVTPWDWIAAAAAGTATMISTISAIHSATGYAEGGIIKGNSYSGDNLMAMGPNGLIGLNAGEIVLNKSQQNNLASQLQGGGMQNLNLTATIKGEQIRLALNNNGRRTGRGEYVQSRNVR